MLEIDTIASMQMIYTRDKISAVYVINNQRHKLFIVCIPVGLDHTQM